MQVAAGLLLLAGGGTLTGWFDMAADKGVGGQVTPRQMEILRHIRDYGVRYGYSPTMQELAEELAVSKVTIFEHVERLCQKGLLRRRRHAARSLALTGRVRFPDQSAGVLPLVGYIAAGAPIDAIAQQEELELGELLKGGAGRFALRVRGDSMVDEQIRDGDYVIVEPRQAIRNGQTVVALLSGGEATLKRYYRQGNRIRLQPANPDFEPIHVDAAEVEIQGIVVGVVRRC